MIELDKEDYRWVLFKDDDKLYLDVCCNNSAAYYSWLIELNEDEKKRFEENGRNFLTTLSNKVQHSGPGLTGSTSPYNDRKVIL